MSGTLYVCNSCDVRFEHEGERRPRCPKCMRVHGIEKASASNSSRPRLRAVNRKIWIASAAALIVAALGFWGWRVREQRKNQPYRPLDASELQDRLVALHVDEQKIHKGFLDWLDVKTSVEDFADEVCDGHASHEDKAKAVSAKIQELRRRMASDCQPYVPQRKVGFRTATQSLQALQKGKQCLFPLETAALAIVMLRAEDVPAVLSEVYEYAGDKTPPEPSGFLGEFAVAIPSEGSADFVIVDVHGKHQAPKKKEAYRVLTDVQAFAAALSHEAMRLLVTDAAVGKSLDLVDLALQLDRRSPSIRSVRASALLAGGGIEEGLEEFEVAGQLEADAPRRNNLAALYLQKQEPERAEREIVDVLRTYPEYAAGHATLAAIRVANGDMDSAKSELDLAGKLDPKSTKLAILWAHYYAVSGESELSVEQAKKAVTANPNDLDVRLQAAQIFRQAGYYDEMRAEAQAILEKSPDARKQVLRELLVRMLGPTVFDDSFAAGEEGADESEAEGGAFQLSENAGATDPSKFSLDPNLLPSDPTLGSSAGGEDFKLHMGDEESGLKLKLDK